MIGLSRPGFRQDYNKNQAAWIARIYNVSAEFKNSIPDEASLSLLNIYTTLGRERKQIAIDLGQGLTHLYGTLRKRKYPARELLIREEKVIPIEKFDPLLDQMTADRSKFVSIDPIDRAKLSVYFTESSDKRGVDIMADMSLSTEELLQEGFKYTIQRFPPKAAKVEVNTLNGKISAEEALLGCNIGAVTLSYIEPSDINDLTEDEKPPNFLQPIPLSHAFTFLNTEIGFRAAVCVYGSTSLEDSNIDENQHILTAICEAYLRKAFTEHDPEKCKIYIAKIMFLLAKMIPVLRGNAAIVEITMNAIAEKAGHTFLLQLGKDTPNWDIQALFSSHTMTDYVKWFQENCKTLDLNMGKIVKALKKCEAEFADTVSITGDPKATENLKLVQECLSLLTSKGKSQEKTFFLIKDKILRLHPLHQLISEVNDPIINNLVAVLPIKKGEPLTVRTMLEALEQSMIKTNVPMAKHKDKGKDKVLKPRKENIAIPDKNNISIKGNKR